MVNITVMVCWNAFYSNEYIIMNINKKQLLCVAYLLMGATFLSAQTATIPAAPSAFDAAYYTGKSFEAEWGAVTGATRYLLNVYRPDSGRVANVKETFGGINYENGKISADNPHYPEGWTCNVGKNGSVDMVSDGGTNKIVLDANGDTIVSPAVGGFMKTFTVYAYLSSPDGGEITKDNSSIFTVDVYNAQNQRIGGGQIEALYFASKPKFDLFSVLSQQPYLPDHVAIGLKTEPGRDKGVLVIDSIALSYYQREYTLKQQQVESTSFKVDNLDPEKFYFYDVYAANDEATSAVSNTVLVDGFLTPATAEPTDITTTGYTARWEYLPKVFDYKVNNYEINKVGADGRYAPVDETFDAVAEGTTDNPISITNADPYTAAKGWTGAKMLVAKGMLGADGGTFRPYNPGYLHSPQMDLSGADGTYTVHLKAYGTPGDYLSVYRIGSMNGDQLNLHATKPFNEDGYVEETWTMNDGNEQSVLSFEENKIKRFFLDEVTISQQLPEGTEVKRLMETVVAGRDETECIFDSLAAGRTYGYTVQGRRYDAFGNEDWSEVSAMQTVVLPGGDSGVGSLSNGNIKYEVSHGMLTVRGAIGMPVTVSTVDGVTIYHAMSETSTINIPIKPRTVYVLKAGGTVVKVLGR